MKKAIHPNSALSLAKSCKFLFIREERGAVAGLFAVIIFFSIAFTGISLDYALYIYAAQELKSKTDQAALAGAIACRENFLTLYPTGASATLIVIDTRKKAENKANWTFNISKGSLPNYLKDIGHTATATIPLPDPTKMPEECKVSIAYSATSQNFITSIFGLEGFPVIGNAVVETKFSSKKTGNLEIDFLIDVSGSMSTIANPEDRDWAMALTRTLEASEDNQKNGCIFMCHSRHALVSYYTNYQIAYRMMGAGGSSILPVNITYGGGLAGTYNGGTATLSAQDIRNRRPTNLPLPKFYTYSETLAQLGPCPLPYDPTNIARCALPGDTLLSLNNILNAFNIKLKSEVLYDNIMTLLNQLNADAGDRIKVAFHKFSEQDIIPGRTIRTFMPASAGFNSRDLIPIRNTLPFGVNLSDVDYDVPNVNNATIDVPRYFPVLSSCVGSTTRSCNPLTFAPNTPTMVTSPPSIRVDVYPTVSKAPLSRITQSLVELNTLITSRPPPPAPRKRVVVLITDGIENTNRVGNVLGAGAHAQCQRLKDLDIELMVIHSYYRFQPGNDASDVLRRNMGGTVQLHRNTIDQTEQQLNEGPIKNALLPCTSANPNPKPGQDPNYYFPANNVGDMHLAFQNLMESILNVGPEGDKLIKVVE